MLRLFARFGAGRDGNVALIFALSIIPFMVLAGFAIDIGRAILVRERLGHALDAAILAVGASPQLDADEAQAFGEEFFHANFDNAGIGAGFDVNVDVDPNGIVTMNARATVPTTLLAIIGRDEIEVYQEAEAIRGGNDLELVMVLDNTGSMGGSKITALRSAAEKAVDIIFNAAGSDPDAVKIGLVPFAATVNVGSGYARAAWLDPDAHSPVHAHPHTFNAAINRWDLFDEVGKTWAGCVEARVEPYDMEDVTPTEADPSTLFVPYFAADTPGDRGDAKSGYTDSSSWLDDGEYTRNLPEGFSGSGIPNDLEDLFGEGLPDELGLGEGVFYEDHRYQAMQAYVGKYFDDPNPSGGAGPNEGCIGQAVTPMTTDSEALVAQIQAMSAGGTTNIANGAAWGVRLLSPQTPFTEGRAYGTEELVKAMIVLTDGDNVLSGRDNRNESDYTPYGFIAEGRFGIITHNSGDLGDRLDTKTAEVCEYAKEQGIRVYTITFQVSSTSSRNMMRDCASTDDDGDPLYWNSPSTEELERTFLAIARDLVDLRLSK